MKLPVQAPSLSDLMAHISHEDLTAALNTRAGPEVNGSYVHWDKLRHLTPPEGLSANQWWLAIKLARRGNSKRFDLLQDKSGVAFSLALTDSMNRRLHHIDREAAGSIAGMGSRQTDAQNKFLIRSLMEEAMTSSQLEGASTTRAVAKDMLKTGRKPRDQSERMIYNNYMAMREVKDRGQRPFTAKDILELHSMLTADTLESEDQCGRLRTAEDNVVIYDRANPSLVLHVPPKASELPKRLERLCKFANAPDSGSFFHPVARAIAIHFQLAYDHPFCDGNGRTARLLFYWAMLNSGYWLMEYLSISSALKKSPGKYMLAYLHTETDECDMGYFIAQQLEALEQSIEGLHGYIARKSEETRRAETLLKSPYILGKNLNHRQRALLANALRSPESAYTVASHQGAHRITYPTALNDLNDLASAKLLRKERVGKANYFSPTTNLAERLSEKKVIRT
ncbi:MAG: Fic family protein [Xanthomonadales bacterium]|nr:Fic family protein [Xanthomonadales bacterium]